MRVLPVIPDLRLIEGDAQWSFGEAVLHFDAVRVEIGVAVVRHHPTILGRGAGRCHSWIGAEAIVQDVPDTFPVFSERLAADQVNRYGVGGRIHWTNDLVWGWRQVACTGNHKGMILAIVVVVIAILLGLGGFLFKVGVWILILAAALLVVGIVLGAIDRGRSRRSL